MQHVALLADAMRERQVKLSSTCRALCFVWQCLGMGNTACTPQAVANRTQLIAAVLKQAKIAGDMPMPQNLRQCRYPKNFTSQAFALQ